MILRGGKDIHLTLLLANTSGLGLSAQGPDLLELGMQIINRLSIKG